MMSGSRVRIAGWGLGALMLLFPLVANAPWSGSDYVFAAVMIGGAGLLAELAVRLSSNTAYRGGMAAALAAAFLTIWVNAAVGMIGDGDNALNAMFAGVLAIALLGALLVRFGAAGMARVMAIAGAAQFVAGAVGAFTDLGGGIFSACFAGLWLLSAMLFGKAGNDERSAGAAPTI